MIFFFQKPSAYLRVMTIVAKLIDVASCWMHRLAFSATDSFLIPIVINILVINK